MSNIVAPNMMEQIQPQLDEMPREEKEFMLMLHLHVQPSEAEKMPVKKLDWLVARLILEQQLQMQHQHSEFMRQQEMLKAEELRQKIKI